MWDPIKLFKTKLWRHIPATEHDKEEWYCDFKHLERELMRELSFDRFCVLIPGAGFSTLSSDLVRKGFKRIIHIDISEGCIEIMKQRHKDRCPTIKFRVYDAFETTFKSHIFDAIVDKAFFDEICCECNDVNGKKTDKYLKEMARVVRPRGNFIVISLGIPCAIERLLTCYNTYFESVEVRWLPPRKSDLTVQKPKLINLMPLTYCVFSPQKFTDDGLARSNIKFYNNKNIGILRFLTIIDTIGHIYFIVADSLLKGDQVTDEYVVVVLDEKYRQDITFYMDAGVRTWARKHKARRVCFIFGNVDSFYARKQDGIKKLASYATPYQYNAINKRLNVKYYNYPLDYIPLCINYPIKCSSNDMDNMNTVDLTLLNTHHALVVTRSLASPNYWVSTGFLNVERHLIFKLNPCKIYEKAQIDYRGNVVPHKFLSEHYWAILQILASIGCRRWKLACIGFGVGKLPFLLSELLPITSIISPESSPTVAKLASLWFGFKESPTCSVVISEGMDFILSLEPNSIDCIIYDINNYTNEQGMKCPLHTFLKDRVLTNIVKALTPRGAIILNVVAKTDGALNSVILKIQNKFSKVNKYLMKKERNYVMIAFKNKSAEPIKINNNKLMALERLKHFRKDKLFKTVMSYFS